MSTFEAWPKIPRWNRNVVITEKIDGTNAAIIVERVASYVEPVAGNRLALVTTDDGTFGVYAQSRTRLITREADNQGFASWVSERAPELVELLGEGRHFGEFYGAKIGRKYGLDHQRFALFNTSRWEGVSTSVHPHQLVDGLAVDVVPVLDIVSNPDSTAIGDILAGLREQGSWLVPGFMKPEGIVLYHTAARRTFKILLEGDELPKGVVPRHERDPFEPGMTA